MQKAVPELLHRRVLVRGAGRSKLMPFVERLRERYADSPTVAEVFAVEQFARSIESDLAALADLVEAAQILTDNTHSTACNQLKVNGLRGVLEAASTKLSTVREAILKAKRHREIKSARHLWEHPLH